MHTKGVSFFFFNKRSYCIEKKRCHTLTFFLNAGLSRIGSTLRLSKLANIALSTLSVGEQKYLDILKIIIQWQLTKKKKKSHFTCLYFLGLDGEFLIQGYFLRWNKMHTFLEQSRRRQHQTRKLKSRKFGLGTEPRLLCFPPSGCFLNN